MLRIIAITLLLIGFTLDSANALSVEVGENRTSMTSFLFHVISDREESKEIIKRYNADLKMWGGPAGEISYCSDIIDIPGGRNHSYGGYCSLHHERKSKAIIICNAEMTSQFKVEFYEGQRDVKTLATFIVNNCYGG